MTLVETTASIVIMVVITGSVVAAARVMVVGATGLERLAKARQTTQLALARFREEVGSAMTISELTETSITFTHPDMDGDSVAEVIRYSWAGMPGDPVVREHRGFTTSNLLESCTHFALAVDLRKPTNENVSGYGDEMILAGHDLGGGQTYDSFEFALSPNQVIAQCFTPAMKDATRCRITRVAVQLAAVKPGAPGEVSLSLTTTSAGNPTTTTLDSTRIAVRNLTTEPQWHELSLAADAQLATATTYAVVIAADRAGVALAPFDTLTSGTANTASHAKFSANRGAAWDSGTPPLSSDARLLVYGRFNVATKPTEVPDGTKVTAVYVEVTGIEGDQPMDARAGAVCVNAPPLMGVSVDATIIRNRS